MGSLFDSALKDALLFARGRPEPVTADDLAAAQGIHRNVARGRLERLVREGFLIAGFERRSGRSGPGAGRPAKTYRVAPEVTPLEFPRRRYEELLGRLVSAIPERERAGRLYEAGVDFGRSFARGLAVRATLRDALESACGVLRRAGFQAAVAEADDEQGLLVTPTCPLRPLVRANAHACELDHGFWAGLIGRFLSASAHLVIESSGCGHAGEPCFVRVRAVNTSERS